MSVAVSHPEITWAQRSSTSEPEKNIIYLTINAPDIQGEPKLDITANHITFEAKSGGANGVPERSLAFDFDLFDEIIPEETKKQVTSRAIVLIIRKKELKIEYWPRITKEKVKNQWIKTDFSKWVDEDEQDEGAAFDESEFGGMGGGMPGMDMGGMGGMPGMGGMGGMPGMGGMGGMGGGMDFASMMSQMGGAGGMGDMDFSKLAAQMGAGGMGEDDDDEAGEVEEEGEPADKGKAKEASLDDVE